MEYKVINSAYPNDGEIGVQQMSVTYIQNPDTNDDQEHFQYLKITTVDVPEMDYDPENPMYYFNIEIPNFEDGTPGHWSICEIENITEVFNDFKQRLINNKKK